MTKIMKAWGSVPFLLAVFLAIFRPNSVFGATSTWSGSGGNPLWTTTGNWVGSAPPAPGSDVAFPSNTVQMLPNNNLVTNIHSITFGAGGYQLNGNPITVTNGFNATNVTGATVVLSVTSLGASQSFTNLNPGAELAFIGLLNLGGRGLTFRGAGTNLVNGVVDAIGGGGLTNDGTGTFFMQGTDAYTGPTVLNSGTNLLNGIHRSGPITWAGGTLGGVGHLGAVTATGVSAKQLVPGYNGTGILETSNLVLNSSVTVAMQINGTGPGTNHDQLVVTNGNLTIGSATLNLSFLSTLTNAVGDSITLVKLSNPTNTITGTFTNAPEGTIFFTNGYAYQISYTGGDGNDVTLTASISTGVTRSWDGGGANSLWTNPTNWSANAAPSQGDALSLPGNILFRLTNFNDFAADTTFDSLFFGANFGEVLKYALSGNAIRLNNGVVMTPRTSGGQGAGGSVVISNHVGLNFSQIFTNSLDAELRLAGGLDLAGNTLYLRTRANDDGSSYAFDSSITGDGMLQIGAHTVHLRASNSITGGIVLTNGLLFVEHAQALGTAASGPVLVGSNAVLRLQASNTVFTGSSIFLTGRLDLAVAPNAALSAPLTIAGSNAFIVLTNTISGATNFTFQGVVTNSTQFTNTGFGGTLHIATNSTIHGAGVLYNITHLDVDGIVHNPVNNSSFFCDLSGSGQIDTLISPGGGFITPGSESDPSLAFNPLRVGTLSLGASSSVKLQFSLFPNRPSGGPTNTAIITSNAPTLGVSTLTLIAVTNLGPNQKFTILRNDSAAPVTNTFFNPTLGTNIPEGTVIVPTNGNYAVSISYTNGDGNDIVLTVLSNTPPAFVSPVVNLTVAETNTLSYTNTVTDIEKPPQTMTWTLLTPTNGFTLNPTNGVLNWTPFEAGGPATNTLLIKATDSGTPPMSSTGTVIVTINEINQPPVPVPVPDTNILGGVTVTVQLTANDPDIPANPLTWQLFSNIISGASVTTNGLFTYASSLFDVGLKTNWVRVYDTNAAAINKKSLTNVLSFVVNVLPHRIVTNTNNDGPGSLRQALADSEQSTNFGCYIEFNIPGAGVHKIAPTNALPDVGQNATIDGYTQPGAHPNTKTNGTDAVILIELSGENQSSGTGLNLGDHGITVRGLCINRFTNGNYAISLGSCCGSGSFCDKYGDVVEGCFIGTDTSGTVARPNTFGVNYSCAQNSRLGGADIAQRNLISGSVFDAVYVSEHPSNPIIQNNLIGTDRTGTNALPNGRYGLFLSKGDGSIGFASCLIADNVIVSSAQYGLIAGAPNLTLVRNKIGVGADGATALGNGSGGLYLTFPGNLVGGTNASNANLIGYNNGFGVDIFGANTAVLGNSIFRNTARGIKLESGANNNQSAPALMSATAAGSSLTIVGSLASNSNTTYRIEFFHNSDLAPSNAPQAWVFLGFTNVTTDGSSNASFSVTFNQTVSGGFITTTATDPSGNTSEISDGLAFSGSPRIDITRSGSQIRVLWLSNLTSFTLQSNANLAQPNNWSNVPGSPGISGTNFFRDFPANPSPRFFRLRSP